MEAALLADVLANPASDATRLVLADWWMQRGDPRGEFVIVQCEAERADLGDGVKARMDERAAELLKQHQSDWLAPMELAPDEVRWRRGFVEDLTIRWDRLQKIWQRVFATTPLRHAHPHFCRKRDEIRAACALPWPSSLTSLKLNKARDHDAVGVVTASPIVLQLHALELSEYNITDDGARSLAAADLRSLRELDLGYNAIGPAGVAALASAPSLTGLTKLSLTRNGLGVAGAVAVADGCATMPALAWLSLMSNPIGDGGAAALAACSHLAGLRELLLLDTQIGAAGVAALAGSASLRRLSRLVLGGNQIGVEGARALARSQLGELRELSLDNNPVTDDGARAIAGSDTFARLEHLSLNWTGLTGDGALALARSPRLPAVSELKLSGNALGSAVAAIAQSPIAARLRRFELKETGIDDDAAVAIASSADLAHLLMLDLSGNPVGERGLLALAASPHLRELVWLNLYACQMTDRARAALRERFGRHAVT